MLSLQPFALLWFFGINHQFQFWGKSQCWWIWPPEEMPPLQRALAQFPTAPSLLLPPYSSCSWEQAIPKVLLGITLNHPNDIEIYNPNEISSCQTDKESCSHHILPDHSHSLFLSIFLNFRLAIFLSMYTQSKRLLASSKHNQHNPELCYPSSSTVGTKKGPPKKG